MDVLCVSEHWLTCEESDFYMEIDNLKLENICCRSRHKNGGAAVYVKNGLSVQSLDLNQFCSEFNLEVAGIVLKDYNLAVLSIYRSDAGEFDIFLDLLDSCLNYILGLGLNVRLVLGGDFNVPLNCETTQTRRVTDLLRSYGLYWSSKEPTRGLRCLDSSASNCNIWEISTKVTNAVVADHLAVITDISVVAVSKQADIVPWLTNYVINVRKIDSSLIPLLKTALGNVKWNFIFCNMDANLAFNLFFDKFLEVFDSLFPVLTFRPKSSQSNSKKSKGGGQRRPLIQEWYTEELKILKSWVLLLHDRYKSAESSEDKDRFFRLYLDTMKQYKRDVDNAKRQGNSRLIEESLNPCKAAWNLINSHRKKEPVSVCSVSPDEVNNFFIHTVDSVVGGMSDWSEEAASYVKNPHGLQWTTWRRVSASDVSKIVSKFKHTSSVDAYGLSTALLREIIDPLAEVLSLLFNMCLEQGIFPNKLKLARTVPVFKKGDSADLSSFRPISIIPVFAKILETVMNRQLMSYFESNNLLTSMQHGFRRGKSTVTAVQTLVQKVYNAFEDHESVLLTLCDLSKAFDCTSHKILLLKLRNYGIGGTVLTTFQTYLEERLQLVTIRGASSQVQNVRHGVPQGSVLGPLLFLILVNDLNTSGINALLYADDTTLMTTGSDINQLSQEASASLENAKAWFELNNLRLNDEKTQKLFCSLWSRPTQAITSDTSKMVKLLGILIDEKLSWNCHVEQVCVKLSRINYLLRKLKNLVTPDFLLKAYYGLFHSHINYGIILWGHASCCDSVFLMQKIAVRIITSSERLAHCRPLFQQLGVPTVYCQYILSCILHLKNNAALSELTRDTIHRHNTRGRKNLNIPQCRLTKVKDSYPVLAYKLFNKLPAEVRGLKPDRLKVRLGDWLVRKSFYSLQEFLDDPVQDI